MSEAEEKVLGELDMVWTKTSGLVRIHHPSGEVHQFKSDFLQDWIQAYLSGKQAGLKAAAKVIADL